jgi:hypothetical protein
MRAACMTLVPLSASSSVMLPSVLTNWIRGHVYSPVDLNMWARRQSERAMISFMISLVPP